MMDVKVLPHHHRQSGMVEVLLEGLRSKSSWDDWLMSLEKGPYT